MSRLTVQHFHDEPTGTLTYVVHDDATRTGAVIDSLTDYDPKSAATGSWTPKFFARKLLGMGTSISFEQRAAG